MEKHLQQRELHINYPGLRRTNLRFVLLVCNHVMHSPDIHSVLTVVNKYTQKYSDFLFSLLILSLNNLNMKHKIYWGKEKLATYLVLNLTIFHWHINNHLSQWDYKGLKKFLPCLLSKHTTVAFIVLHWSERECHCWEEKKKKSKLACFISPYNFIEDHEMTLLMKIIWHNSYHK